MDGEEPKGLAEWQCGLGQGFCVACVTKAILIWAVRNKDTTQSPRRLTVCRVHGKLTQKRETAEQVTANGYGGGRYDPISKYYKLNLNEYN